MLLDEATNLRDIAQVPRISLALEVKTKSWMQRALAYEQVT